VSVQIAALRKQLTRLRGQADSRKADLEATVVRLAQFQDSVQAATEKIDDLVDAVASKLSQPIADDVQAIQRDQQLFQVDLMFTYLMFSLSLTVFCLRWTALHCSCNLRCIDKETSSATPGLRTHPMTACFQSKSTVVLSA